MHRAIKTVDEQGQEWTTPNPNAEQRAMHQASRPPSPESLIANQGLSCTSPQADVLPNTHAPATASAPTLNGKDFPPLSPPTVALSLATNQPLAPQATDLTASASASPALPPMAASSSPEGVIEPPVRPSKSSSPSTTGPNKKTRAAKHSPATRPSIGRIREILAADTPPNGVPSTLDATTLPSAPPTEQSPMPQPQAAAALPRALSPPSADVTTIAHPRKRRRTDGDIPSPTITLAVPRDDNRPAQVPPPAASPAPPPLPTPPSPSPPLSPAITAMSIDVPPISDARTPEPEPGLLGQEPPLAHETAAAPPPSRTPSPEQQFTIAPSFRQHGAAAKIYTSSPWQAWIPLSPSQERGWQHSIGVKKAVFCAEYAQTEPIGVASTDRISADLSIALQRPTDNAVQVAYPHPTTSPPGTAPARSSVWHFVHDLHAREADTLLAASVISRDGRAYIFLPAALNTSQPVFLYALNGLRGPTTALERHLRQSISSSPAYQDLHTAHQHHPDMPHFLHRIRIDSLPIRDSGGRPTPAYRLYAHLPSDDPNEQQRARDSLRSISFDHHLYGAATQATYKCRHCHGVDHPSGLCPFPSLPGWQGPNPLSRPTEPTLDALPPPVLPEAPSSLTDPPANNTGRGRGRGRGSSRGGRGGRGRGSNRS
ncbi:hypothetical protein K488DRAFT_82672 [Vararia minispora EC-137]|uniref:Uncharacterized protein n=1 Tax=Vararia minispora EC-137 TaxID=1314806 RepID=A0ACB8QVB0_9AGAM|nr:hypothetical protein K488DRAFT_82672 [Vararia minispora EC-137]